MHKKFEINRTKIKGGCQSGRKVVTHNSKSDLPLEEKNYKKIIFWKYTILIFETSKNLHNSNNNMQKSFNYVFT